MDQYRVLERRENQQTAQYTNNGDLLGVFSTPTERNILASASHNVNENRRVNSNQQQQMANHWNLYRGQNGIRQHETNPFILLQATESNKYAPGHGGHLMFPQVGPPSANGPSSMVSDRVSYAINIDRRENAHYNYYVPQNNAQYNASNANHLNHSHNNVPVYGGQYYSCYNNNRNNEPAKNGIREEMGIG